MSIKQDLGVARPHLTHTHLTSIYDTPAYHPVRILEAGRNVIIRNNTIIGEDHGSGRYKYRTAVNIEGVDPQNGTPDIEIYNNIFIGIFDLNTFSSYVTTSNNFLWSVYDDTTWLCDTDMPDDHVYACSTSSPSDPQAEMESLFANEPNLTFADQHGNELDFTIAQSSIAYNYGDSSNQPATSLGSLHDNFIIDSSGVARSASLHSSGAYEYGTDYLYPTQKSSNLLLFLPSIIAHPF